MQKKERNIFFFNLPMNFTFHHLSWRSFYSLLFASFSSLFEFFLYRSIRWNRVAQRLDCERILIYHFGKIATTTKKHTQICFDFRSSFLFVHVSKTSHRLREIIGTTNKCMAANQNPMKQKQQPIHLLS